MYTIAWGLGIAFAVVLLGVSYQILGTLRDKKTYPPPGRLVDLGTHRLHILESGHGSGPTIVLEAGLMSTVLSWIHLQRKLECSFRVVSYDRAGLGWSDIGPMPRTAERTANELHELLKRVAIAPPYVLVGHSFGGLTMPVFAARFPKEVAGMVLVDPVAPSEWSPASAHAQRLTRIGAKVCRRAALLARIGAIRFVAFLITSGAKSVASKLVRLISREAPEEAGSVSSPWFWALPDEEKEMARVFWPQPKFALTIASQLENLPASARSAASSSNFCKKPVAILSAGNASEKRRKAHAEAAKRLPDGTHIVAGRSGHWIMQDEPELVIRAIEEVLDRHEASRTAYAGEDQAK
jgi:pimeloyl-ACP methyl ester carboxylesterase